MKKKNVVVTFKAAPDQKKLMNKLLGKEASLTFLSESPAARRGRALREADVLVSWNVPREITPEHYADLGRASLLQLLSAGADHVPFAEFPSHIAVAANVGAYAGPMAEHALAMILALAKRLLPQHEKLRTGEFDQFSRNRALSGLTAGIVGFGGIGRATARLMRPFGIRIQAINTTGQSPEPADFIGTLRDLERVLKTSDVIVLALPLTKATRGLIGKKELGWMKYDAILVNVARGALIDERALYEHAKAHPEFEVGIDAWWTEPFMQGRFEMEYPFLDLPNVLGSPHNSAFVPSVIEDGARHAAANIIRFLRGEPLAGLVRREDYV